MIKGMIQHVSVHLALSNLRNLDGDGGDHVFYCQEIRKSIWKIESIRVFHWDHHPKKTGPSASKYEQLDSMSAFLFSAFKKKLTI